jgi:hypothetical protein
MSSPPIRHACSVATSAPLEAEVGADDDALLVSVHTRSPLDTTASEEDQYSRRLLVVLLLWSNAGVVDGPSSSPFNVVDDAT